MSNIHKPTITQRALAHKYWLWVGVEAALQLVIDSIARLKERAYDHTSDAYEDLRHDIIEQHREQTARATADCIEARAKLRLAQARYDAACAAEIAAEAAARAVGQGGAYSHAHNVLFRGK